MFNHSFCLSVKKTLCCTAPYFNRLLSGCENKNWDIPYLKIWLYAFHNKMSIEIIRLAILHISCHDWQYSLYNLTIWCEIVINTLYLFVPLPSRIIWVVFCMFQWHTLVSKGLRISHWGFWYQKHAFIITLSGTRITRRSIMQGGSRATSKAGEVQVSWIGVKTGVRLLKL